MNPYNVPIFILFFAIVYLTTVYGLLKMAEAQKQTSRIVNSQSNDAKQRVETP
ncbi:MAG: hypothetical protein AAFO95_03835 [Cyanobacteria bacterium J06600_6]